MQNEWLLPLKIGKDLQEHLIVGVVQKDFLACVATSHRVEEGTGKVDSGRARHVLLATAIFLNCQA